MPSPRRSKKCKVCGNPFVPRTTLQSVCFNLKCALEQGKRQAKKRDERKRRTMAASHRADKQRIKTRSQLLKEAQKAFNAFIRLRDDDQPCISCGETNPPERFGGAWDCGHYLTVGAHPELRFDELNASRQCKRDNAGAGRFAGKGRTVQQEYRVQLIERIGLTNVEWLEGPHKPKKYSADDLRTIKTKYQKKVRELKLCLR